MILAEKGKVEFDYCKRYTKEVEKLDIFLENYYYYYFFFHISKKKFSTIIFCNYLNE